MTYCLNFKPINNCALFLLFSQWIRIGRGVASAEVDAITKSAHTNGHRFGRSASMLNTNGVANAMQPLAMSPPLSMSTGSDRASPICSLSPTNSLTNFQFSEHATYGLYSSSSLHITPPASPPMLSGTPPSTPNAMLVNASNASEKSRLPIFNQISCVNTMDTMNNLQM